MTAMELGHLEGVQSNPILGTKTITMVINHLRPSWDDPPSSYRAERKGEKLSEVRI